MGFSSLKKGLGSLGDKVKDAAKNVVSEENLEKTKKGFSDAMSKMKEASDEMKKASNERKELVNEAKAPVDGAFIRYQVIYLGGFPMKPQKKSDSLSLGFNIMEDRFIFKPEYLAKTEWFGEDNLEIPYEQVTNFEVVKRQVSTTEALMSSNGDTKSLEQENNIQITYKDNDGDEHVLRVEMLTGTTIYGQANKCREMLDLLREKKILKLLTKEETKESNSSDDALAQLEKLASLKEKGIISEDEFNEKKSVLLSKL